MAKIETLAGISKITESLYEVTSPVNVGAGIDSYEGVTFVQKGGGILMFASGNTSTFTRCTFIEESSSKVLGADNFANADCRFKTGCSSVFKGCRWYIAAKTTAQRSDLDTQAGAACTFEFDGYGTPCYFQDINSSNSYNHLLYSSDVKVDGMVVDHVLGVGDLHFTLPNATTNNLTVVDNGGGSSRQVVFLMKYGAWADNVTAVLRKLEARNVSCYEGNNTRTLKLIDPKGDITKAGSGSESAKGRLEVYRTYKAAPVAAGTGNAIQVKGYLKNTSNNTVLLNATTSGIDQEVLQYFQAGGTTAVITQNAYLRGFCAYSYLPASKTFSVTEKTDGSAVDDGAVLLFEDTAITENTKATVDAYSEIETAAKFYDRAKASMVDNYAGETRTLVTRSGDTLDARALDVVIDKTASSAFALSGNTITIKADAFTGNLITTGTVTLANGASVSGGIIDSNGDSFLTFDSIDGWTVYASDSNRATASNALATGTGSYRFSYSAGTTYYLKVVKNGTGFEQDITPAAIGETVVSLAVEALLSALSTPEQTADATYAKFTDANNADAFKADLTTIDFSVMDAKLSDLWDFQGLNSGAPLTVTPSQKSVNGKTVEVSGDGVATTTVKRTA